MPGESYTCGAAHPTLTLTLTHSIRAGGAANMQDRYASEDAIRQHGRWLMNVLRAAYLTRSNPEALLAAAGFQGNVAGVKNPSVRSRTALPVTLCLFYCLD